MIAPFGFDVSAFMPRQGSPAVDMARAGLAAAADQNAITQRAIENLFRQRQHEQTISQQQLGLDEDARQANLQEMGLRQRAANELAQEMAIERAKQAKAQRDIEAGIVGDVTKAFGTGDLSTIESLQQRAKIQAPQLSFQLPGSLPPANEMGIADPFASPMTGLSISRGGETLYSGDTAEMRRRNQEIVREAQGALTGGPEGDAYAPYVAAGIATAGLGGYDGKTALRDAIAGGDKAAQRQAYREGQRMLSLRQDSTQVRGDVNAQRDRWNDLHNMAKGIAKAFEGDVKLNETRAAIANAGAIREQVASGVPLAQNMGRLQILKQNVKGAASDYDAKQIRDAAGKLLAFEQKLNDYIAGGEMPEGFQQQMLEALDLVDRAQQTQVRMTGLKAADGVYRSPGFIAQVDSPEEAALFGLQAYQDVTGDSDITPQDIQEEADRIRPMFAQMKKILGKTAILPSGGSRSGGGGGTGVVVKGDIVPQGMVDGLGGLGTAPLPPKPSPNPAVQRAKQLMGIGNGGQ